MIGVQPNGYAYVQQIIKSILCCLWRGIFGRSDPFLPCSSVAELPMVSRPRLVAALLIILVGCDQQDDGTMRLVDHGAPAAAPPVEEPPVAINPVSPVRYPPALLAQGIEGRVLLRLFVDSAGNLIPDSTRIAESSGYPALDSAALLGSPQLRFSPALHQGRPIAAPFLQPVHFRSPRPGAATQ
jgi:TonB family protein